MNNLLFARIQMGYSLAFHIIFAVVGIAMPVLMAMSEIIWLRRGNEAARELTKRWAKGTAIFFAVGAVSGTVLSFELGLLWPKFMEKTGPIVGIPFSLEGFAFFTEAIFLGVYLYGWDRISKRAHLLAGIVIALSGAASAGFVMMVNAWMNCPGGIEFDPTSDTFTKVSILQTMFSRTWLVQTAHMLVAAYAATGFAVAGVHALALLKGKATEFHQLAFSIALTLAIPMALLQILVGDWTAKSVANTQPIKFAAMEGQFETERRAPLRLGGIPDAQERKTRFAVEIPGLLSFLGYGDFNAQVKGLNSFPPQEQPPLLIPHLCFQLMVLIGMYMALASVWCLWTYWKKRTLIGSPRLLVTIVGAGPLGFLALEAGWMVTEIGRQPWALSKIYKVSEVVTPMPGLAVPCAVFFLVYCFLALTVFIIMRRQFRETTLTAGYDPCK
ncbi:MAG: cytochrome ubiquinol oxidase subunit I [Deltaproteobacteria bacterium]|nr:cytochrome ubiquinol oxidase subunit I [Deltaproteobacteria bacterium]